MQSQASSVVLCILIAEYGSIAWMYHDLLSIHLLRGLGSFPVFENYNKAPKNICVQVYV